MKWTFILAILSLFGCRSSKIDSKAKGNAVAPTKVISAPASDEKASQGKDYKSRILRFVNATDRRIIVHATLISEGRKDKKIERLMAPNSTIYVSREDKGQPILFKRAAKVGAWDYDEGNVIPDWGTLLYKDRESFDLSGPYKSKKPQVSEIRFQINKDGSHQIVHTLSLKK